MKIIHTVRIILLVLSLEPLSAPAKAIALEKITASYGAISGSSAPIWVAKEAHLFEKQGLDVDLVYIPGPRNIMALVGGSVQFANHSGVPALESYKRGSDATMIASPMDRVDHSLVVQKSISNVDELRGKVLGFSSAGSLTDVVLREGLRLNGLSEKDVTLLAVGDESARLSGIRNGRLHGAIISGIQLASASKMGFRQLIDFSKLPIEIAGSGIVARRSYLVKNPDISLRFLKGWVEGIYVFKSNPQLSRNAIKKYVATQDQEVLETIYAIYKDKLALKPVPRLAVVKYMAGLLSRNYAGPQDVNLETFAEPRFVNDLEKSGFFDEMNRRYQK
jgi:ABC-type nitrate/sulfonate/bicarbonate transport system substrate-binding protein